MKNPIVTIRIQSIQPTIFFRTVQDKLYQKVVLNLDAIKELDNIDILFEWQSNRYQDTINNVTEGKKDYYLFIPDIQDPTPLTITLIHQENMVDTIKVTWKPTRHWQIHLVHGSHHDLGYTDLPSNLLREHASFMDEVLDFCDATDEWQTDSKFRYLVEQGWSILYYLQNCPQTQAERLLKRIKENRIEVTALLGNETTELCSQEELIRLLYPAFRLRRMYGIDISSAELNDIPGVAWGMASILAGSGIRYFAPALPDYYAWGEKYRAWWDEKAVLPRDRNGAFWWEGPDGQRVLFWHEGGNIGWTSMWSYEQAQADLQQKLVTLVEKEYPYSILRIKFHSGHRDNSPPDSRLSLIARQWNEEWTYPRLIVSTNRLFFSDFEAVYGEKLPVLRGDIPNTDYHFGAYSTARETAANRQAHDMISTAEKFAACASMINSNPYPAETLAEAYDSMLMFDEHTWGMAHPIGPAQDACWAQKAQFAFRAQALAQDVLSKSTNLIADQIQIEDDGYHIVIFNPLSFPNTSPVNIEAVPYSPCGHPMYWLYPKEGENNQNPIMVLGSAIGRDLISLPSEIIREPFKIIDLATNRVIPHQIRVIKTDSAQPYAGVRHALSQVDPVSVDVLNFSDAQRYDILFTASDVPSLGYKTYRLVPLNEDVDFNEARQEHDVFSEPATNPLHIERSEKTNLENTFYRIELDPVTGGITSIIDKESGLELVDSHSDFLVNQLVTRMPKSGQTFSPITVSWNEGNAGPVLDSVSFKTSCLGCPQIIQEILLYHEVKRIDFNTRILRDSYAPLEIFLAFPFAADQPSFQYEGNYANITPITDQLPGTNTDSYTIQHWLRMYDKQRQITFSSPDAAVVYLSKMWSGSVSQAHLASLPGDAGRDFLRQPEQFDRGHIYSCLMINNFRTNFQPIQTGEILFRHSITSSLPSKMPDWHFGWQVGQSLQPVILNGPQTGKLPFSTSFFQVTNPDTHLLTLKAAEDGDGLILRLVDMNNSSHTGTIQLPYYMIKKAGITNFTEENLSSLPFGQHQLKVPLTGGKITTIRCTGKQYPSVKDGLKF